MSVVPIAKSFVRPVAASYIRRRVRGTRSRLLMLSYHRILPRSHSAWSYEQPGMVVSDTTFEKHLQWLSDLKLPIVSASEWVRRAASGTPKPGMAVALTFDDGWHDNLRHALPVLEAHKALATIFVCPGRAESQRSFWPQRLGRALTATDESGTDLLTRLFPKEKPIKAMNPESFDALVCRLKSLFSDRELEELLDKHEILGDSDGEDRDLMNVADLRALAQNPLIEFGSHSDQHARVTQISDSDTRWRELVTSKNRLVDLLDKPIDLFCYPNGDTDPLADELVRRHYRGACLTERGWNKADDDMYGLRRVGLHEDVSSTLPAFTARLGYAL